ncbi:MAG: hypothetical protein LBU88_07805 [Treponema sp.]|jgi:hypothetical protein|nr:hypothetical protein [Treponema sp.]
MRIAHIYNGRVHNIFESDTIPDWPPYTDGKKPLLIKVSDSVKEMDIYDEETGTIISDPFIIQRFDIILSVESLRKEQLAILRSEVYQKKAESDSEFAAKVIQSIEEWENIENQPDFPDEIDWPEFWEEAL